MGLGAVSRVMQPPPRRGAILRPRCLRSNLFQRTIKKIGRRRAIRGVLGQTGQHQRIQLDGNRQLSARTGCCGSVVDVGDDRRDSSVFLEHASTCQQPERHTAQRVDVRPPVDDLITDRLFRGYEVWRAGDRTRLGHRSCLSRLDI